MTLNQSAESDIHPVIALFDVDGTLLRSGGAARGALERAMEKLFGIASRPEIIWDGKTDPQIVRELMTAAGIANSGEKGLSPLFEEYLQSLKQAISESPDRIRLYPGVLPLLEELDTRTDVVVGLLTGNIEAGARLKLEAENLADTQRILAAILNQGVYFSPND